MPTGIGSSEDAISRARSMLEGSCSITFLYVLCSDGASCTPSLCVRISVFCGSCSHGSKLLGMNSGHRCRIRMNEKPLWR